MKQSRAKGKILMSVDMLARSMPFHSGILSRWQLVEDKSATKTAGIGFRRGKLTLVFNPDFIEPLSLDHLSAVLCHEVNHLLCGHLEPVTVANRSARILAEEISSNEWVPSEYPLPGTPPILADFDFLSPNESTEQRYEALKDVIPVDFVATTCDDHSLFDEVVNAGSLGKAVVATSIASSWGKLSAEQKKALPQHLRDAGQQAAEDTLALSPGTGKLNWKQLLRLYVGKALERRPTFNRPPRRFPSMTGIIPGRARHGSKPKILCCIDTSGSMTKHLLEQISGELTKLSRSHQITICEFDTKVHRVYEYRQAITSLKGRGGTSFLCLWESSLSQAHKPDLILVCTDGGGPAGDTIPKTKVLWLLTPNGKKPAVWGKCIQMT
ncbi:MAG: VWA-like domain-containing protein [bacterium]